MKTRILLILITLLCAAMASVQSARAATITVTNTNDSGAGSLRQALADANDGDTINFAVTTPATIALTSGQLVVTKSVTISGPGADQLSVNGNAAGRVFFLDNLTVTISNLTISNGTDGYWGGGILNEGGTLTISNCTISGNSAGSFGGGILNEGALTISNCTISGNSVNGWGGGGIFNWDGELIITNSTFTGNSAGTYGGGVSNEGVNCNFCATATITNSTFSDNSAPYGGGISDGDAAGVSGGFTIGNTILKASGIYSVYFVPPTSLGYNMSDDGGGGFLTGPGDQIYTAPMLGPLQDNGGPTFTHALLCGSPAIDAGNPSFTPPPDYDQRGPGYPRVVNGRIDIGAFEVQGTSSGYTGQVQPPINADGTSIFTVKRGVVPVKFTLVDGCVGGTTCALPPATIAVTRIAGGIPGAINESVYSGSSDSGSNFRIAGCQYQYNLYSSGLGVGTYRIDILINSQAVGSATFQLK